MGFWSLTKLAQVSSRMPFELVQSGVNAFWLRFVQVLSLQAFAPGWDIVDVHWLGPLPALCEPLGSSYLGLKGATSQPSFTCSNLHTLIWCWGHIPTPPWKKWNYSPWHIWLVVIILQTAQEQLTWDSITLQFTFAAYSFLVSFGRSSWWPLRMHLVQENMHLTWLEWAICINMVEPGSSYTVWLVLPLRNATVIATRKSLNVFTL